MREEIEQGAKIIGRHHSTVDYDVHKYPIASNDIPRLNLNLPKTQGNTLNCALREHVFVETLQNRFMSCRSMRKNIKMKYVVNWCKGKVAQIRKQYEKSAKYHIYTL
jgi:hypothetical protein